MARTVKCRAYLPAVQQSLVVRRILVVVACVVLGVAAVGVALWLSRPAVEVPGTLIRVDSVGRASRTITAAYVDDGGFRQIATYSTGLGYADGNRPGATVPVFLRGGVPVDEPPPLLTALGTCLLVAFVLGWAIVWLERRSRGAVGGEPPTEALGALD